MAEPERELEERLAQLEAENAALRSQVAAPAAPAAPVHAKRRSRGWTVLATVLIVLACLLAPVAVATGWAKVLLTDTESFVATYAPLAEDPEVQAFVTDKAVAAIDEQVHIDQLTADLVDGLAQLGMSPRADAALRRLQGAATAGLESLIRREVDALVHSDAFAQIWEETLRVTHKQLVATLQQDPDAVISAENGTIGIQIAPIMEAVKAALVARGIDLAAQIPTINKTIPIAQSDALPTIGLAYRMTLALGTWLPWVVLGLLAAGVLVARRRAVALIWAAIGLGLAMGLMLIVFTIGRQVLLTTVPPAQVPPEVIRVGYDTVINYMRDTAAVTLLLAVVVAVVAWLAGPFATPGKLRSLYGDGIGALRSSADSHGITTGRVGTWLYAQRSATHLLVAVVAAVIVVFGRPLTTGLILGTLVGAVIALIVLSLLERPPEATSTDQAATSAAPAAT